MSSDVNVLRKFAESWPGRSIVQEVLARSANLPNQNVQRAVAHLLAKQKVQQPVGQIPGDEKSQQIVKKKDKIIVAYALSDINKPIGVSEYRLTESIPATFKGNLPTIEEIEGELGGVRDEC